MKKDEKDILKELKAKSDAFKMPVSPDLWDAIEAGIEPDKGKKKGIAWWKIGGVSGAVLLLGTAMILSFGGGEEAKNNHSYLTSAGKHKVEVPGLRFNDVQDSVFSAEPVESVMEIEEIQEEEKSIKTENKKEELKPSIIQNIDSNLDNDAEEGGFNKPKEQGLEETDLGVLTKDTVNANSNGGDKEVITSDSLKAAEMVLSDTVTVDQAGTDSILTTEWQVEENKKKKPFSIMLTGGAGTSFRTLRSNTHGDLVIHKNDHETFGNAFDVGVNVQYDLSSKLFLRTGFNYKFYSDKYDFHHDLIVHTTRNDYQYIQVPLSLGWRALNFGKSDLSLIGIAKWNRLYSAQSSWVDPSLLTPVAHNHEGNDTPFRKSTLGIGLALDYRIRLSEKWNVHFIPGIDCFASSVYKRSTDIYQRPYALNADVGISYNF